MDLSVFTAITVQTVFMFWMKPTLLAILIVALTTMISLAGVGAVVVLWLTSQKARKWLYEWDTTRKQRKHDRNLDELLDATETYLSDINHRSVVIDISV